MKYYHKLRSLNKSPHLKSIQQLAVGSIIAQLITILVSPISTRLYTSEELGVYTLLITFVSLFGPIICGRFDLSIVTATDDEDVYALVKGSLILTILLTILVSIGYYIYILVNKEILNTLGLYSILILPILLLAGVQNILMSYNNRLNEYKLISKVYVYRTTMQNIGLVLFGIIGLGESGLLLSKFFSDFVGIKTQSKEISKRRRHFIDIKYENVVKTLYKYRHQFIYSMPAQLVNSASYSILNFMITSLFGISVFGYYSLTYRILGIPLAIVSVNISKVFFRQAAQSKQINGNYQRVLLKNTILLAVISLPMVLVLLIWGPQLFEVVFGDGWKQAGTYAQLLAPMYGIRLVVSALTPALIISNKQRQELILQLLFIFVGVFSFVIIKGTNANIMSFLKTISIGYSFVYLSFYIYIYKLSKEID